MKTTQPIHHPLSLLRHGHPMHWHGSMVLAIVAILLTSLKSSGEMLRALQAVPVHAEVMNSVHMRDSETRHMPEMLSSARYAQFSGK